MVVLPYLDEDSGGTGWADSSTGWLGYVANLQGGQGQGSSLERVQVVIERVR